MMATRHRELERAVIEAGAELILANGAFAEYFHALAWQGKTCASPTCPSKHKEDVLVVLLVQSKMGFRGYCSEPCAKAHAQPPASAFGPRVTELRDSGSEEEMDVEEEDGGDTGGAEDEDGDGDDDAMDIDEEWAAEQASMHASVALAHGIAESRKRKRSVSEEEAGDDATLPLPPRKQAKSLVDATLKLVTAELGNALPARDPNLDVTGTVFEIADVFNLVVDKLLAVARQSGAAMYALMMFAAASKQVDRQLRGDARFYVLRQHLWSAFQMNHYTGTDKRWTLLVSFGSLDKASRITGLALGDMRTMAAKTYDKEPLLLAAGKEGLPIAALSALVDTSNLEKIDTYITQLFIYGHISTLADLRMWLFGSATVTPRLRKRLFYLMDFGRILKRNDMVTMRRAILLLGPKGLKKSRLDDDVRQEQCSPEMFALVMDQLYGVPPGDDKTLWNVPEALESNYFEAIGYHDISLRFLLLCVRLRRAAGLSPVHTLTYDPWVPFNLLFNCVSAEDVAMLRSVYPAPIESDSIGNAEVPSRLLARLTPAVYDLIVDAFGHGTFMDYEWERLKASFGCIQWEVVKKLIKSGNAQLLLHVLRKYRMHDAFLVQHHRGPAATFLHIALYSMAFQTRDAESLAAIADARAILATDIYGSAANWHTIMPSAAPVDEDEFYPLEPAIEYQMDTMYTYVVYVLHRAAHVYYRSRLAPYFYISDPKGTMEEREQIRKVIDTFLIDDQNNTITTEVCTTIFGSLLHYAGYRFLPLDISFLQADVQRDLYAREDFVAAGFFTERL